MEFVIRVKKSRGCSRIGSAQRCGAARCGAARSLIGIGNWPDCLVAQLIQLSLIEGHSFVGLLCRNTHFFLHGQAIFPVENLINSPSFNFGARSSHEFHDDSARRNRARGLRY